MEVNDDVKENAEKNNYKKKVKIKGVKNSKEVLKCKSPMSYERVPEKLSVY